MSVCVVCLESVIEKFSERDKILVAAIDIGTTYSGYAFSFKYEYDTDPTKVNINQEWRIFNFSSLKTPTLVLCDPKGDFDSFGYDAEETYTTLTEDDAPHKWYFFRRFKLALYKKQIQREFEVEGENGLKMPARKVFGMAIRYLKEDLFRTLNCQPKADNIHWILTVPAIWTDSAKQFVKEAANEAGIDGKNLTIALEPEAAAMYNQLTLSDCLPSIGSSDDSKYMITDIGGETVDITVHIIRADGTMNVVYKASSSDCGGNIVNEVFNHFLMTLIGTTVLETFRKRNMHDYMEMRTEFERTKRLLCTDSNAKVSLSVPVSLINIYEKLNGETILKTTLQSPHDGHFEWKSNKIVLDADLFQSFFQKCIRNLTEHIAEILNMPRVTGTSTILMVGGFSECKLIQEAVRKAFPTVKVVKPVEAELAILRGAVMLGHMTRKAFEIATTSSKQNTGETSSPCSKS